MHYGKRRLTTLRRAGGGVMNIIVCPGCNAKGKVYEIYCFSGVMSFGITALMDLSTPSVCPTCGGSGFIYSNGNRMKEVEDE